MRIDRLITGGTVATPDGLRLADVAITGGKIAALVESGTDLGDVGEEIDATGLIVMPGFVDVHVHTREPGYVHKEDMVTCTQAAAAGGVTTVFGMPNLRPAPASSDIVQDILATYNEKSIVDFNLNPAATNPDEIAAMAELGIAAFKVYMVVDSGRDYPHPAGVGQHDHGKLLEMMERVAATGLPFMVHPHDQAIMDYIEGQYWAAGDRSPEAYAKTLAAYDGIIWDTAIGVLLRLAEATGCRLHIVHAQTRRTLEMLRDARARGVDVTAEVNHWALFLSRWEDVLNLGPYALSYWVPDEARDALWEGINDGTIDIISSDHAPHTREEKEVGWTDMWAAHTGTPGVQFQLPLLLDAASKGFTTVERAIEMVTRKPADIFGLTQKGRILPGADADIALVNMNDPWTITNEVALTKVGWTPYNGREISVRVIRTMVRGVDVFRDGAVVGTPGHGKLASPTKNGEA
jgi:dihydroorotase (multifunctional complex type)